MKIRHEVSDEEEIVIRTSADKEKVSALKRAIEEALLGSDEIILSLGDRECFVKKSDILFFESADGKVFAHTEDAVYRAPYKLFELESVMPQSFTRVSKSAIVNIMRIGYLKRELVGNGEIGFFGCDKKVYFSRGYYKLLEYKTNEMRLLK